MKCTCMYSQSNQQSCTVWNILFNQFKVTRKKWIDFFYYRLFNLPFDNWWDWLIFITSVETCKKNHADWLFVTDVINTPNYYWVNVSCSVNILTHSSNQNVKKLGHFYNIVDHKRSLYILKINQSWNNIICVHLQTGLWCRSDSTGNLDDFHHNSEPNCQFVGNCYLVNFRERKYM